MTAILYIHVFIMTCIHYDMYSL